ncbi:glycosyltransferase, partial [Myxococcota bacterium]|nr:glycosyltransferase [Myxococcota bacterium]
MRIAIVTIGTRGDLQPYLAVGRALAARSHEVVVVTHDEFAPQVRALGLEHRSVTGGLRELLRTELGRKWISSADSPRDYARYGDELFRPITRAMIEDVDRGVDGCQGVIFYAMALGAIDAAERRGLPIVCMAPWTVTPSGHLPSVWPWLDAWPRPVRRAAWSWIWRMVFSKAQVHYQAHRRAIGLPAITEPTAFHRIWTRPIPTLHLWSEHVLPRPPDWPAHAHVAGYAFLDSEGYVPPASLTEFLAGGEAPIYIGFGSMSGHSPEALARVARAAGRRAGVRVIYVSGWGEKAIESDDHFLALEDVPHDWLFPRVRAVVHHGGSSTFGAGLRAGRPTIIVPFFGDQ